jgi:hypothetical protein
LFETGFSNKRRSIISKGSFQGSSYQGFKLTNGFVWITASWALFYESINSISVMLSIKHGTGAIQLQIVALFLYL